MVTSEFDQKTKEFDPRFKIFHELMIKKVREILLISTPYDAWIMEEDCRLSERIINEYRGLNLSHPPRLNWVSSAEEALVSLDQKQFDMVITMSRVADLDAFAIGKKIKKKAPDLPVILLSHQVAPSEEYYLEQLSPSPIDRTFVWSGNTDILLALIKSAEDQMNVVHDTNFAGIRVIIFVEDSPAYISSLLPILYKELVTQTQAVMEEGLNEEHRLLAMRARPKILVAQSYQEAISLFEQFEPNVLTVISDVRFPRQCVLDGNAGVDLLKKIKKERFDIPLLLTSSEPNNAEKAASIPAIFVDKNSPSLHAEVNSFFLDHLGFGDFVFRLPDRQPIARASNLRSLEKNLYSIPDESFVFHCNRNDFSRWLFARSEIELASRVRPIRDGDFTSVESHRQYLSSIIHTRRMRRQKGIIVNFDASGFDLDTDFFKIGTGSLGGKGRGLAFVSSFLQRNLQIHKKFDQVNINIPQMLVITTEGFDEFVEKNDLKALSKSEMPDEEVAERFLKGQFPSWLEEDLRVYISHIKYPLAVRSSSLLEDAQFRAYAGLYKTYMLANDHPDFESRLNQLINAVKLVYASTYYNGAKAFSRRVGHRTEEEKMAVIIQRVAGEKYGDYLYPSIAGVVQSHNYYPFGKMKPEEGIATIALGLGKTVMDGEKALRFSPKYPEVLPQRATVDDILENSQRFFYALKLGGPPLELGVNEGVTLAKREISDETDEPPLRLLASTYIPEEQRIRDTTQIPGYRVLTFSQVLKYNLFPLADLLVKMLSIGQEGMGCPVELEFSVNLGQAKKRLPEFAILQIRPMTAREELIKVDILDAEIQQAICFSSQALGNGINTDMADIVYVKPNVFDPGHTPQIAHEIGCMNTNLLRERRKYLLIGPGRWGSADRWLGIPVSWSNICGVGAMVETTHPLLKAEPSQGSHFFHNITTLGINYLTVSEEKGDFIDWNWLKSLPLVMESTFIAHVRVKSPITLKVDGRKSCGAMLK
jgi:DNA-binding NarL/FixJ family response regulator